MRDLNERIDIDFDLVPQKRFKKQAGQKGVNVAKGNTGNFYNALHAGLFGGIPKFKSEGEMTSLSNGECRGFSPDVVRVDKYGHHWTEVKGTSLRSNRPYCGVRQLETGAERLLRAIKREKAPSLDYSFFSFGNRDNQHLHELSSPALLRRLCEKTNRVVIVPLNLAFLLFLNSSRELMNQSSARSSDREYFRPNGNYITSLASGLSGVNELFNKLPAHVDRDRVRELLALDELFEESYISRPNVYVNGVHVASFNVAHYKNHDYQKVLETFRENHAEFLRDYLRVQDLRADEDDIVKEGPF